MTEILQVMAGSLWVLIPTYVANAFATFSGGRGPALDFGRTWPVDGERILGPSKTWLGVLLGTLSGLLVGLLLAQLILWAPPSLALVPRFGATLAASFPALLILAGGALGGDALGSFFKRRLGFRSSESVPLLDQVPFVLVPLLLLALLDPRLVAAALGGSPFLETISVAWILLLTLFLHTAFNWVGYFIGAKKVPW
jgi:CDP-2,3-bis-(O-geranylgeranyl)-sn-glycerol synthase